MKAPQPQDLLRDETWMPGRLGRGRAGAGRLAGAGPRGGVAGLTALVPASLRAGRVAGVLVPVIGGRQAVADRRARSIACLQAFPFSCLSVAESRRLLRWWWRSARRGGPFSDGVGYALEADCSMAAAGVP